jgi:3'-phosphoadenosine 5'-phosphosulfate sulfotransferase (PAPS reductase)/FAD synthetase
MWSGGKDSTVMVHLLRGFSVPVASEKDDLDYPREREYVERLARRWGLALTVLVPPLSPRGWIEEHRHDIDAGADIHSRAAELSKRCFYEVVEAHTRECAGIFLGLRAEESRARSLNRATRGSLYQRRDGQWVCAPLSDLSGLDVFAYAFAHGIELLPVYRCVGLMHAQEPWRVRKSWWLPGESARFGGVVWLRRYWPSLHAQMVDLLPGSSRLT